MMIAANYIIYVAYDHIYGLREGAGVKSPSEGFANGGSSEPQQLEQSKYAWLTGADIYDDFFAGVYDKLVQGEKRSQAEVVALLAGWKRATPLPQNQWRVLDIGCGTGVTVAAFARGGVTSVVGMDRSPAMIRRARDVTVAGTTLTPTERGAIHWKIADMDDIEAFREGEFTHACAMYFSFYYASDKAVFFRNLHYWVKPGGCLSIATVNKHKFDPMLEAAAPTAFSMQKYASERIMKSKVAFANFDYEGEFDLGAGQDTAVTSAEFRETFRFKDGTIRRQRHEFTMPDMKDIVAIAQAAGWKYTGFTDGAATGFDYSYIMSFSR
jgi:SAM-dependent methyltransferase